jgi:hypothetical protein
MERSTPRTPSAGKKTWAASRIVGKTRDGVVILRPKARPKHFTSQEIRDAIREVVRGKAKRGKRRATF